MRVKEESESSGLKLNIKGKKKTTKIMASGLIAADAKSLQSGLIT